MRSSSLAAVGGGASSILPDRKRVGSLSEAINGSFPHDRKGRNYRRYIRAHVSARACAGGCRREGIYIVNPSDPSEIEDIRNKYNNHSNLLPEAFASLGSSMVPVPEAWQVERAKPAAVARQFDRAGLWEADRTGRAEPSVALLAGRRVLGGLASTIRGWSKTGCLNSP